MKNYNHLSFQRNNLFPSTQATEQASQFVNALKRKRHTPVPERFSLYILQTFSSFHNTYLL